MSRDLLFGFIDPRRNRKRRWSRDLANEAFRVLAIGVEQDGAALFSDRFGSAVVDVGRGMKSNARVAMIVVIPRKKTSAVGPGVLVAAEAIGEVGSVLEGPELRFTEYGLSLLTWGRLCDLVTPRSASRWTTCLAIMGDPRSECRVS